MDLKTVEKIPVRQLLLSPMYLLHHFTTAMVPGVLAVFVLMMKQSLLVSAALSATGMLGYKTRIVLGLLVAFVLGKIIQAAILLILKFVGWIVAKAKTIVDGKASNLRETSENAASQETAGCSASAEESKENPEGASQVAPGYFHPF